MDSTQKAFLDSCTGEIKKYACTFESAMAYINEVNDHLIKNHGDVDTWLFLGQYKDHGKYWRIRVKWEEIPHGEGDCSRNWEIGKISVDPSTEALCPDGVEGDLYLLD